MSHLNFNIRAPQARPNAATRLRARPFNPRAKLAENTLSMLWTVFAVMAVAGATFAIVWFA